MCVLFVSFFSLASQSTSTLRRGASYILTNTIHHGHSLSPLFFLYGRKSLSLCLFFSFFVRQCYIYTLVKSHTLSLAAFLGPNTATILCAIYHPYTTAAVSWESFFFILLSSFFVLYIYTICLARALSKLP